MTMQFIASAVITSSASQISISNIPATFTHLQLRIFGRTMATEVKSIYGVQFNGDYTIGNYGSGYHYLAGDGATPTSGTMGFQTNGAAMGYVSGASATSNVFGSCIVDILDYTNANKIRVWRSISGFDNNGSGNVALASGLYLSTNAITSINIGNFTSPYTFAIGSRADLYGITTSELTGA